MSHPDCAFGYAQARVQARLGARVTAADWQRLNGTRELAALLQLAAATPLAPWTRDLAPHLPVHARGTPAPAGARASTKPPRGNRPPWRASIAWLRWLPDLPALEKLARGGVPPEWMRADGVLGPLVAAEPRQRAARVRQLEFAPLAAGFSTPPGVGDAWLAHWRQLWPADRRAAAGLEDVVRQVRAARLELDRSAAGTRSQAPIARLEKRVVSRLRRHPLSPVTTVAWLALVALDLLQLRGSVAVRALQAAPGVAA